MFVETEVASTLAPEGQYACATVDVSRSGEKQTTPTGPGNPGRPVLQTSGTYGAAPPRSGAMSLARPLKAGDPWCTCSAKRQRRLNLTEQRPQRLLDVSMKPFLCPIKVAVVIYRRIGHVIVDRMLAKLKDGIFAPVSLLQ